MDAVPPENSSTGRCTNEMAEQWEWYIRPCIAKKSKISDILWDWYLLGCTIVSTFSRKSYSYVHTLSLRSSSEQRCTLLPPLGLGASCRKVAVVQKTNWQTGLLLEVAIACWWHWRAPDSESSLSCLWDVVTKSLPWNWPFRNVLCYQWNFALEAPLPHCSCKVHHNGWPSTSHSVDRRHYCLIVRQQLNAYPSFVFC